MVCYDCKTPNTSDGFLSPRPVLFKPAETIGTGVRVSALSKAKVRSWRNSEMPECAPHFRLLRYTGRVRHRCGTSKMTQVRRCRWDPESGPVRAFIFLAPTHVGPTNRGLLRRGGVKRQPAFSARRANPTCQAFSQSLARKHNPSDISRLVDLGPMPRFKDMKRSIPGLRSHVLGDGDMKIGVGLSPNE